MKLGAGGRWLIPWVAFAAALALHLYVASAVVNRALSFRAGEPCPLPAPLLLFNDAVHRRGPGADFFALYHAAVALEQGAPIYGAGDDGVTPPYYPYRYLPIFAQTVGRLVRLLDPWTAYVAWLLFLEGLLVGCVLLTWSLFRDASAPLRLGLCSLWFVYTPLWLELQMGQFSFVTAALLYLAAALTLGASPRSALLPWIASVALKIYPAVLLPLWWRRRWLLPAAALSLLLALASWVGFSSPSASWRSFFHLNFGGPGSVPADAGNFGLSYLLHRAASGLSLRSAATPWLQGALVAATLGAATLLIVRRRDPPLLPSIALLVLAHQLSYKHVWEHHYVLVLPMGLLLLRHLYEDRAMRRLILCLLALLALPSPFIFFDRPGGDPGAAWPLLVQLLIPASKALPTLGLFGIAALPLLARAEVRAPQASTPHEQAILGDAEPPLPSGSAGLERGGMPS